MKMKMKMKTKLETIIIILTIIKQGENTIKMMKIITTHIIMGIIIIMI